MTQIEEQKLSSAEMTWGALTTGNSNDELVICLHGWLDNAASFLPLLPLLKEKRVIALDWPGHGHSSHRGADAYYHFIDYVFDLLSLFEQNKWQKVHIVGHSMGAMVASAFAAAFPERVASLTLIDAFGFIYADGKEAAKLLREGMLSRLAVKQKTKNNHPSLDAAIQARVMVSDLSKENAALIVKRGIKENEAGWQWRSDPRLRTSSPYRLTIEQANALVSGLSQCPLLLIYGNKGMEMVQRGIKEFKNLVPEMKIIELQGGHHVHMEQTEQTAKAILTFINASR